ncbi:MAG: response regulator [Planctomycetes bacterium]|nr:response regulator [Planctomycetota bacterium]
MSRPLNVLLVEDDDPLRDVLLELLRQHGFSVHATARGDDALELARRVEIDFSILDFHLPGLTGLEVYRRIASEVRPLPSILISGDATREDALRALDAGVVEFLRKPLDLAVLRRCLDSLLRRHFAAALDRPADRLPGAAPHPTSELPVRLEDLYRARILGRRAIRRRRDTGDGA